MAQELEELPVVLSENSMGKTAAGAIIGAAVGGTAGALIGHNMDKQAEEMRQDIKNAKIERVGEGIKITFDLRNSFRNKFI